LCHRHLVAEFVAQLSQTDQFLFKSAAPMVSSRQTASVCSTAAFRCGQLFDQIRLPAALFRGLFLQVGLVRRHLLKFRLELLSLLTLLLEGGSNLIQFHPIRKNARRQFLALLLLLFQPTTLFRGQRRG